MNEIIVVNLTKALQFIMPAMISLVAAIIVMFINRKRRSIQEKDGIAALEVFDGLVQNVVKALNQTIVRHMKKNSEYGLTIQQGREIKEEAIKQIVSSTTAKTMKDIKYIVKDVDTYIDNAIESKVADLKNE